MTRDCGCQSEHQRRRIVVTGGPGAGKTAVLELLRQSVCHHVRVLPESAGIVFGGGFPRSDSATYWCGPEDFWSAVGTSREAALARYDAVVHLRVPNANNGYGHQNPLRVESAAEALEIDERILQAWAGHPRRYIIDATSAFLTKAQLAVAVLQRELPECCRSAGRELKRAS